MFGIWKGKNNFFINRNHAFSLIEVSMVILIIGLMIGTIITVEAITKNSEIVRMRNLTREFASEYGTKNLVFWIEPSMAKSFTADSENVVTSIVDQGTFDGGSDNASVASSDNAPVVDSNGLNQLPSFLFDGEDDYLMADSAVSFSNKKHSIFVVFKMVEGGDSEHTIFGFSKCDSDGSPCSDRNIVTISDNEKKIKHRDKNGTEVILLDTLTDAVTRVFVLSFVANGTNSSLYINGDLEKTFSDATENANTFSIGQAYGGGGSTTDFYNGYIGEVIIFNEAVSTAEREATEVYLMNKWKIDDL